MGMQVVLLQDVAGVGRKSEVKSVAEGHARNFLIPRGFAAAATAGRIKGLEKEKAVIAGDEKVQRDLLLKNLESFSGMTITLEAKANEKGHLFKGIHKEEIVAAIVKQAHFEIPVDAILLEEPIKQIGEQEIPVSVGAHNISFKLQIQSIS